VANDIVLCRVLGKYLVYVDANDVDIGARLALNGYREPSVTSVLARTVQPGWRCIDVGAGHGYYTMVMADAVGPGGCVLAVEPSSAAAILLEKSVELNGFERYTRVLQLVASDKEGTPTRLIPQHHRMHVSIGNDLVDTGDADEVNSVTLYELAKDLPRVDLVKIDVEGSEGLVWQSMQDLVDINPAMTILMEVNSKRYDDPVSFYERLGEAGFNMRYVDFDARVKTIDAKRLAEDRYGEDRMLFLQREEDTRARSFRLGRHADAAWRRSTQRPLASVVIVAFGGGWAWLSRALDTLHRNTVEPIEVIVIDNGRGGDRDLPSDSCTLVRNTENVGFGPASNYGAELARSETVCFLNPDVLVEPGWLSPLLAALREKDIGAVFPAKLNLDGTMQEAGAFMTSEGGGYHFGDGDDASSAEYAFRREIDYGSAACMCVSREVFSAFAGFDPLYRFAYFEDADLCFRLREFGLRVLYEPRSRVRHVRTVSASRPEVTNIYAANRVAFMRRWGAALAQRPSFGQLERDFAARIAARDFHTADRILVPDDAHGAAPEAVARTRRAARDFASRHGSVRVTLVSQKVEAADREDLHAAGVEVACTNHPDSWLENRRGHYSVVVGRAGVSAGLGATFDETHPHVRFWPLERLAAEVAVDPPVAKRLETQ
jgi:FkbM family methyltransferase